MNTHKIGSKSIKNSLNLELFCTPKTLVSIRNTNKQMFMVMFKLETDEKVIEEKIKKRMKTYNVNLVNYKLVKIFTFIDNWEFIIITSIKSINIYI